MFAAPPKSSSRLSLRISQLAQTTHASCNGTANASHIRTNQNKLLRVHPMFGVHQEKIGDVSVIICKGKMAGCDASLELGDEVRRHGDASVALLDLSELISLGADVIGMLVVLQVWTRGLGIQFKLYDPPLGVLKNLRRLRSTTEFEIATIDDVLALLHWSGPKNDFIELVVKPLRLHAA
jgi:hypothetical protein